MNQLDRIMEATGQSSPRVGLCMAAASQVLSQLIWAVGGWRDGSSTGCRHAPVQVQMQRGSARLMAQLILCLGSCSPYRKGSQWSYGAGILQQSATSHLCWPHLSALCTQQRSCVLNYSSPN